MEASEQKFRHITDNSNELIFVLNEKGVILRVNAAARKTLGFRPEEMQGEPFSNFISDGTEDNPEMHRTRAQESLSKVLMSEGPAKFRVALRMKQIIAGMEMDVVLQKFIVDGKIEILGKSVSVFPEASELFLRRERGTYVISSNLAEGEMVTRGLISRLARYFEPSLLKKFQVGIGEILLNAIEHGNLGISFAEKTREIANGDYIRFLLMRQKEKKYAGRKVRIDFVFDQSKILLRITDEGEGFDHVSYMKQVATDDSMLELEHGRGITIARNTFDRIEYNDKGNQILLVRNR